jgi:hypothetical protein
MRVLKQVVQVVVDHVRKQVRISVNNQFFYEQSCFFCVLVVPKINQNQNRKRENLEKQQDLRRNQYGYLLNQ